MQSKPINKAKRIMWTDEMIQAKALKYKTRLAFQKGSNSAYHASLRRGILNQVCQHMESQFLWDLKSVKKVAKQFKTRREFESGKAGAYQWAQKNGVLDQVCLHMPKQESWTADKIRAVAKKCKTKNEFRALGSPYVIAKRFGILEEVCGHMKPERTYWTEAMLKKEAKKYRTKVDMKSHNNSLYTTIRKRKLIDVCCSHMEDVGGSDYDSIYLWKSDMVFNGLPIYKVGITSERCGNRRIEQVARKAGFTAEIIMLRKVRVHASLVEAKLKKIGTNPKFAKFDGSTEFRAMTKSQLKEALALIEEFAV